MGQSEIQLRKSFVDGGQGHVFNFFDDLTESQKKTLLETLASVDVEKCNAIFKSATKPASLTPAKISPLPSNVFESIITAPSTKRVSWNELGLTAIAENKVK